MPATLLLAKTMHLQIAPTFSSFNPLPLNSSPKTPLISRIISRGGHVVEPSLLQRAHSMSAIYDVGSSPLASPSIASTMSGSPPRHVSPSRNSVMSNPSRRPSVTVRNYSADLSKQQKRRSVTISKLGVNLVVKSNEMFKGK